MAYEKQTWVTGEVITKEKLNHMEDGIANSGGGSGESFIIHIDSETGEADKTWREVFDALASGKYVNCYGSIGNESEVGIAVGTNEMRKIGSTDTLYAVYLDHFVFPDGMSILRLIATSEDGYLTVDKTQ